MTSQLPDRSAHDLDDVGEQGEHEATDGQGSDSPSLRQRLHAATGDRDREAEALADRSPDDVSVDDAKVAVNRAHGDSVEDVETESELASPSDAADAAAERRHG